MSKKIFSFLTLVLVAIIGTANVSAMTEEQLRNKVGTSVTINNTTISVPKAYLNQLDSYLAEFEVSASDCDYIASQIDSLLATARAKNVTSIDDFYNRCSSEIKASAANISANTGVKVTVLGNGKLSVNKYNSNETWGIIDSKVITNTNSANFLYVAGAITILGTILLVVRVRRA